MDLLPSGWGHRRANFLITNRLDRCDVVVWSLCKLPQYFVLRLAWIPFLLFVFRRPRNLSLRWGPAPLCIQERETEREKTEREREREGGLVLGPECTCIRNCTFERRDLPGCCTNCTLMCWVRRQQQFQSLQNHRWSVRLEPPRATLTGYSPPPFPLPRTASDSGPAPRAVGWCCYCCFSCWEQESQPKRTPVTITRPGGPLLCSTQGFIGTGEHQQRCLWTINNQFAKGRDGRSARDCSFSLSFSRRSVTVRQPSLLTSSCVSSTTTRGHMEMLQAI